MEEWKDIIGYEGHYQISNWGRVYSVLRNKIRVLTYGLYVQITLHKDGHRKIFLVHRLVGIHFIPNPQNKPEINHKDCNRHNNNDWNLEWVLPIENIAHSIVNGLQNPKGETNANSKLTEKDVIEIRKKYIPWKYSSSMLAREYNISIATIHRIVKRTNWKHI